MSSIAASADNFLGCAGLDRGPWIAVSLGAGILLWFWLNNAAAWIAAIAAFMTTAFVAHMRWHKRSDRFYLRQACAAVGIVTAAGIALVWARSEMVGAEALTRPAAMQIDGRILQRIEQPAEERVRLVLAIRHPETDEAAKIRVNVPQEHDQLALREGALISARVRLMPPAAPMLPGSYDFARAAWFQGFIATGSVQSAIAVLADAPGQQGVLARWQRTLSAHVRSRLDGAAGTIAAAFASGDRGAISKADEVAMRDAGLTHLLAISGLHVSAVIAGTYFLALRMLAFWPAIALRIRLPLLAAGIAALAGIGYTLLTGAQVPTVRACVAAMLVLVALAIGREPLSLRMVAAAACLVLLLWPESLVGPSFQMSFAAVLAIIALHNCAPVREFLRPREEAWGMTFARRAAMLLITGLVIEIALMPIVLFHFHRAGVYGAIANLGAIPLVTFVSMPLIALALALDVIGWGAPAWWLAGQSLDLLLAIAHFTASQPGAVKLVPQMGHGTMALFVAGGLWLALWRGRARLAGFAPVLLAIIMLIATPVPDLLISGDGRHVGISGEDERLLVLRESHSSFARDNLTELAGFDGEPLALADFPRARCSRDFCALTVVRQGRSWSVLMSRSREIIAERALAAACERADIVVADRWFPRSCRPRWLKADRRLLQQTGGLAINLGRQQITTVAQTQGHHGWWRGRIDDES